MPSFTATANITSTDTHAVTAGAGGIVVQSRRGVEYELVIESGRLESDYIDLGWQSSRAMNLLIHGPAALTGTAKVQVSEDASTWADLQSGGADIALTAAEAVPLTVVNARYVRALSSAAQDDERTFRVIVHAVRQSERVQ